MFKKFLVLGLVGLSLTSCVPAVLTVAGEVHGRQLWRGTVLVGGDVVVHEDALLTIAPGTKVVFTLPGPGQDTLRSHPNFPGSELIVRGRLVAEGSAAEPIVFRFVEPEGAAGSWGGVNLEGGAQAQFRFCIFTQADSALHSRESMVTVEDCFFENNLVGVRFHSSPIAIRNNTFLGNGTAVRFHFGAPRIVHNVFKDNDKALFITSHPADYSIEQNNFLASKEYHVVLGEEVPQDVSMPNNFWGSDDECEIAGSLYDGRRSDYLGAVRYRPFLKAQASDAGASWSR